MSGRSKIYTKYKALIEMVNLRQLDVYRINKEDGKPSEIIRIMDPSTMKVINIDLNAYRESLSYSEFLRKIREGLEKNGIPINDMAWNNAMKAVEAMDKGA